MVNGIACNRHDAYHLANYGRSIQTIARFESSHDHHYCAGRESSGADRVSHAHYNSAWAAESKR